MRPKVILSDDHPIVLLGARAVIESSGVGHVIAQASTPDELMNLLKTTQLDVLVTDFAMPGDSMPDGLRMIQAIRRLLPGLPIVLLTGIVDIGTLRCVHKAGVRGILEKASTLSELPLAIQTVHRGRKYFSESLRRRLGKHDAPASERADALSAREREVIRMLAAGHTVTRIAHRTHRSLTTISRQKCSAMKKLGLANDAELYSYLQTHERGLA